MKITLKTLQGKQLPIELDEGLTIAETKAKIQEEHKMPAESQKLIAYGKVLADEAQTLRDYNVKDGDFIVVMVQKAKPKPKEPAASDKPQNTNAPLNVQAQQPPAQAEQQPAQTSSSQATSQAQPTTQAQPAQQPAAQSQSQAAPTAPEEMILNLMAISGKSREECVAALTATQNHPDIAYDLLMSGVNPMAAMAQAQAQANAEMADYGDDHDEEGSMDPNNMAEGGVNDLMALANNPQFAMLRQRIISNPNFYNEFMQMLQQTQPQIYETIQQNPQAFMNLILGGHPSSGGAQAHGGQAQAQAQSHPQQPAPGTIRVTQQQMEAIQRLQLLGFSQNRAAQAYFACDENEEFAANFLFEQAADDDESALESGIAASQAQATTTTTNVQVTSQAQQQQQPVASSSNDNENKNESSEQQQQQPAPESSQQQEQQPASDNQEANGNNDGAQNDAKPDQNNDEGSSFQ